VGGWTLKKFFLQSIWRSKKFLMPSTHSALKYHIIFSTKERRKCMAHQWRPRLFDFIGGCLRTLEAVPLAVGGIEDHVHVLTGLKPTHTVASIVREMKQTSSRWIHEEIGLWNFAWQEGYGAFTVSPPAVEEVIKYIHGQEEHHRVKTFQEEYLAMLKKCGAPFDEKYLW
jgi:REP element-mobilizing transposase RayT